MTTAVIKHAGVELLPPAPTSVVPQTSSLPSIAEMRQKMAWMTEFRAFFREYLEQHMDPARHMYSFEDNRYTPLTLETFHHLLAEGKKPALNQDGIHNLMSLYECYIDAPHIEELREEGYYTCRATVRLISFRSQQAMGAGTGSCSTRESKYAYRWVYESAVPRGVEKASLKQREFEGKGGKSYKRYRLDNEDLADVEATVLKMAVKRAKSAAVQALPCVSEMFASVGDPDEERREEDAARQALLAPLGVWMRNIKPAGARAKALLTVFGEPLTPNDVQKLDEDDLAAALQRVEIATRHGIDWGSPTLHADLKTALKTSAEQAKAELFNDAPTPTGQDTPEKRREGVKVASTDPDEGADTQNSTTTSEERKNTISETQGPAQDASFDYAESAALDREAAKVDEDGVLL